MENPVGARTDLEGGTEAAFRRGRGTTRRTPVVRQVLQLPTIFDLVVGTELIDGNDHVNVQHYLVLAVQALSARCADFGMGFESIESSGFTQFTAEYHLRFLHELRAGARVSAHVRMVAKGEKAFHALAFLVDHHQERVAFSAELIALGVDMTTRRTAAFPPEMAARIDDAVAEDAMLDWPAPVNGWMGVSA